MPKRAPIHPNRTLHTTLPPDLSKRLDAFLWSDSEGRVPRAAIQTFLIARIREFFDLRELDLAPYLNTMPGECVVSGSEATLQHLRTHLTTNCITQ